MVAIREDLDKATLEELVAAMNRFVRDSAAEGVPFVDVERRTLEMTQLFGRLSLEMFVKCQGDGDLGATREAGDETTLHRSEKRRDRSLRTVFGVIDVVAYVYLLAPEDQHGAVGLRPVDARMGLSDRSTSYLYEELSQLFCVEQAFGRAQESMQRVFGHSAAVRAWLSGEMRMRRPLDSSA